MQGRNILYLLVGGIIVLLSLGALWYINDTVNTREHALLITRAQTMATLIEADAVQSLRGDESDLTNPAYVALKEKLFDLKSVNTDLRFLYLMRRDDGQIFFLVDSEESMSDDYSPPGQIYDEASEELIHGFDRGVPSVLEVYADRWGDWISALAPITVDGETIALLGVDKNAEAQRALFYSQALLVILATLLLLLLTWLLYRFHRKEQELIAMKSDFVAAAAHELRAPLTGIRWSLASLRRGSLSPELRPIVNDMYERVRGLVDLTNTFLLSASTDHGVVRPDSLVVTDIAPTIAEAVQHTTMLARSKNIHIEVLFSLNERIVLRADAMRLRLVFENLLSNAVKYSPNGSTITLGFEDQASHKVFFVRDHGIGVPKADQKKIFSGYHRASNAERSGVLGSGFGLYMTKKIVDFHRGTVSCSSTPGQGTTFTVSLPAGV